MIARLIGFIEIWLYEQRVEAGKKRPCSQCQRAYEGHCLWSNLELYLARRSYTECGVVGRLWVQRLLVKVEKKN